MLTSTHSILLAIHFDLLRGSPIEQHKRDPRCLLAFDNLLRSCTAARNTSPLSAGTEIALEAIVLLQKTFLVAVVDGDFLPLQQLESSKVFHPALVAVPGKLGIWHARVVESRGNLEDGGGGLLDGETVAVHDAAVEGLGVPVEGSEAVEGAVGAFQSGIESVDQRVERINAGAIVVQLDQWSLGQDEGPDWNVLERKHAESLALRLANLDKGANRLRRPINDAIHDIAGLVDHRG